MSSSSPRDKRSLLRIATAGSVDDGKSTMIGRLLLDSDNLYTDQWNPKSNTATSLALVTDGLRAEREQGITIDVAYRYITTTNRRIILADTPGHEQYTRNMATGASNADLAIILIDAKKGISTQTRRHAFIAALMGVPRFVLAVNKMDLVDYSQERFEELRDSFHSYAAKLGVSEIRSIPISALNGDNVVVQTENTPWYKGEPLYEYLDTVYVDGDRNLIDFRFPVQIPLKENGTRYFAGQIASGTVSVGEHVTILPSNYSSVIASIHNIDKDGRKQSLTQAQAPQSVAIALSEQIDVGRGDMIVRKRNVPQLKTSFEAILVWFDTDPLHVSKEFLLQHTSRQTKCRISNMQYVIDVESLARQSTSSMKLNQIGRVSIDAAQAICFDRYGSNRTTGSFVLIDPDSNNTVAAGLLIQRGQDAGPIFDASTPTKSKPKSSNLHFEQSSISREERLGAMGFEPQTYWFTGLPSSGKSTLAKAFERLLFDRGMPVFRLDGDNVRHGLNENLGFSAGDRKENIRRLMHVARLFNDAGISCIVCAITPYDKDRLRARQIVGPENFNLVWVSTPLAVCEERDPHGLYKKARAGEIANLTGISAPFEEPTTADLELNTAKVDITTCLNQLQKLIK